MAGSFGVQAVIQEFRNRECNVSMDGLYELVSLLYVRRKDSY
jgi:hypothetical protein